MALAQLLAGKQYPAAAEIATLEKRTIDSKSLQDAYDLTNRHYERLDGTDTVAKGSELVHALLEKIKDLL